MRSFTMFALAVAVVAQGQQSPDFGGAKQIEMLKKLSFLEGSWEGTAWMEFGGRKMTMKGSEVAAFRAGGTAIAVDGKYTMAMPDGKDRVVHDAFAVITWSEAKGYTMRAHLANGASSEFKLDVRDRGYVWTQNNPMLGGDVRYTMTIAPNGHWVEIGERPAEGGKWVKFMELDVAKRVGVR